MHSTTIPFQHTRSPKTLRSFEERKYVDKELQRIKDEKFGGEIIKFNRPFGVDYYISLFDTENVYFISAMGGHFVSFFVAEAVVDGSQKVLFSVYTAEEAKKHQTEGESLFEASRRVHSVIVQDLQNLLQDVLPKEAFKILQQDGCFKKSDEE